MSSTERPISAADREARRALLEDALTELAEADDPRRTAREVVRALDSYVESAAETALEPREQPVTDFERRTATEIRAAWLVVLGGALIATVAVAVLLSGGWPVGLAIIGIWLVALAILVTS